MKNIEQSFDAEFVENRRNPLNYIRFKTCSFYEKLFSQISFV